MIVPVNVFLKMTVCHSRVMDSLTTYAVVIVTVKVSCVS